MKATADKISLAYNILSGAKITELDTKGKVAVCKIANKLKKVAVSLDDFRNDTLKKISPEGFESIAMKLQTRSALTPAELLTYQKVDKELGECIKEEREKEYDLDFEPLTEAVMAKLIDSNDFTIAQILSLEEVLG